jgi:N-acetyl-anhydromuramyl-L-alanine amidase AmpD
VSKRSQPAVYRQQQPDPERIREIQQALSDHGYPLEVNGAWDASTVDALKKFQTEQKIENLSGKGKLDSMTLIALGLGPKRESPSGLTEAPKQIPEGK